MSALNRIYQTCLRRFPYISQAVQTSILMGTGDVVAQKLIENKTWAEYEPLRTGQFATVGLFLAGPALTGWYRVLAWRFGEGGTKVALQKVACDQLLFAPVFILAFLPALGFVQGRPINQITSDIKRDYKDIMISNYKLWPAVQIVNFYLTPLRYQVLLVQTVAIVWNTYLSWKTQRIAS